MSAYVVDPKVCNSTFPDLRYMKTQTLREASTSIAELGRTMYAMNINAVGQRYPDSDLPGTYTDGQHMDEYTYRRIEASPIRVYKSLSCYLYQCSEGDVDQLPLYSALVEFKSTIAEHVIESLPEYDKVSWG